ncbi:MAG TPA: replicative DNA helicase [bacterium]|nr:replicative DNA helicase [bacterium]
MVDSNIPEAKEYERAVLGCMMLDNSAIEVAIEMLDTSCFYNPMNEFLYIAICELYEENSEIDVLTIKARLENKGKLDLVGGENFILGIAGETKSFAGIKDYCDILVEQDELRKLLIFGKSIVNTVTLKGLKSDEIIEIAQVGLNKIGIKKTIGYRHVKDVVNEAYDAIVEMSKNKTTAGISSGIHSIDRALGGFTNNGLFILAGKTGSGKTALALDIAINVAKQNLPVLYLSMEMSCIEITQRLISKESPVEIFGIQYKEYDSKEIETLFWGGITDGCARVANIPIIISENSALTMAKLQIKVEKAIREHGIKMIIVDYLQLMKGTSDDRRLEVESITRGLKEFAMEYKIPVVALSQLSRGIDGRGESSRPVLSDLRESGSIEQDANAVMFIHNATDDQKLQYDINSEDKGKNIRELIIRKNRNGECSTVLLYWKPEYASFYGLYRD